MTPASPNQSEDGVGFDPSRITEMLQGVDEKVLEPIIRKAADSFYDAVLTNAHDYLLDNLDYNLTADVSAWKSENRQFRSENVELSRLLGNASLTHELRMEAVSKLFARNAELAGLYDQLIYAVSWKHEGETRHETALRYIRERESSSSDQTKATQP